MRLDVDKSQSEANRQIELLAGFRKAGRSLSSVTSKEERVPMFKCESKDSPDCVRVTSPRQPANYVIVEQRPQKYQNYIKKGFSTYLKVSEGREIVRQINTCPSCYKFLTGNEPMLFQPPVILSKETKEEPYREVKLPKFNNPRFNRARKGPNFTGELEAIRRMEAREGDRQPSQRKKPIVEVVNKLELLK